MVNLTEEMAQNRTEWKNMIHVADPKNLEYRICCCSGFLCHTYNNHYSLSTDRSPRRPYQRSHQQMALPINLHQHHSNMVTMACPQNRPPLPRLNSTHPQHPHRHPPPKLHRLPPPIRCSCHLLRPLVQHRINLPHQQHNRRRPAQPYQEILQGCHRVLWHSGTNSPKCDS